MVACKFILSAGIITLFLSALFPQQGHTQKKTLLINIHNPIIEKETEEGLSFIISETSGIKLTVLWLIRFYQNFISSQHNSQQMCTFVPSCSRFGMKAIKNYGALKGILLASDRLQRCNHTGDRQHVVDSQTGKRLDPVLNYDIIIDTTNKHGNNEN